MGQAEGQAEGGTSGGIAGAWRGMTSSFSVGADDMAGDSSAGTIQGGCGVKSVGISLHLFGLHARCRR